MSFMKNKIFNQVDAEKVSIKLSWKVRNIFSKNFYKFGTNLSILLWYTNSEIFLMYYYEKAIV